MSNGLKRWTMRAGAAAAIMSMAVVGGFAHQTTTAQASSQTTVNGGNLLRLTEDGRTENAGAEFTTDSGGVTVGPNAQTIPHFSGSFTSNGVRYPYTMVGNGPSSTAQAVVHTEIIPIKFVFSVGSVDPAYIANHLPYSVVRDASSDASKVLASPMFTNNPYYGSSQYGDAVMKATFPNSGGVSLQNDQTYPTVTINVPQGIGALVRGTDGSSRISANWWSATEQNLIKSMHIDATTLPIFLMHNVYVYEGNNPANCCILGWHGAMSSLNGNGKQQVQTYMFASYFDKFFFSNANTQHGFDYAPISDIHGLSHEVAEWLQDPFVHNIVPAWVTPTAPQYGCTNLLEAGDPLVGFSPNNNVPAYNQSSTLNESVQGYHPQEIPIAPWFMRQSPANSPNGNATYTYPNSGPEVDGMINTVFANAGLPPLSGNLNWENYSQGC